MGQGQTAEGDSLFVAGVHLKSQRAELGAVTDVEDPSRAYALGRARAIAGRVLEAGGLRCRVDEVVAAGVAAHYVVAGDFNDDVDSETVKLVTGIDGSDTDGCSPNRFPQLLPAGRWLQESRRSSYIGRGQRRLLDQILVSHSLSLSLVKAGAEGAGPRGRRSSKRQAGRQPALRSCSGVG